MNVCATTMGKLEDWLETVPSKNTRKSYTYGISVFETWFGDSITKLIKSPEASRTIERYYVYLKERHPQNTCRNLCNSAIQFLKFHRTEVRPRKSLGIYDVERGLGKHLVAIGEVQQMASVADLSEKVMLGIWIKGFRIGDAVRLKKGLFQNLLDKEPPIEFKLRAKKEKTVYESFIDEELRELLKLYIPSLKNEWIFPGQSPNSHTKDETLNKRLRALAKRAGVKLNGRLTWHTARSLIMREGAQLGINAWNIKRMVGKSIPISDDTYLAGLKLRDDFLKLSKVLTLKQVTVNNKVGNLEEMTQLLARALIKLVEQEKGRPFGSMLGMLAKEEINEREYLEQFLKEEWPEKKREEKAIVR